MDITGIVAAQPALLLQESPSPEAQVQLTTMNCGIPATVLGKRLLPYDRIS